MGNFVRSTAMDYGSLRVITDYGELRVVFLIFQHRSYFFHVGGQNFMFFELSAEQQHLLMHKLPLVDLEPFRQQARKGWWNLEINARPEVMTNISHVCLRPHVIKRHTGESLCCTGDMSWKFWHPMLLLGHQVEDLHELLPELWWVAPGPKQRVTRPADGKPQSSDFGTASHESSVSRIRYHEATRYKSPNMIVEGFRFTLLWNFDCIFLVECNQKKTIESNIICMKSVLYALTK